VNDLLSDVRFWFTAMGLGLVSLVKYLWAKQEKRLADLEANTVRREELEDLRADLRGEHEENSRRLDRIESGVTGTHKRLDELYRDLIGRSER
jgi:hypothetical protein